MKKYILGLLLMVSFASAELVRDGNGIVTDSDTNLMWQDDVASTERLWDSSINYCETLNLAGYNDWRLPNKNELLSIVDYNKYNLVIKGNVFQNIVSGEYWSSTTYKGDTNYVWAVNTISGSSSTFIKTGNNYALCVRAGE